MSDFLRDGVPGWIFPAIASTFVLSTWIAAGFGSPLADAFLEKHGGHVIAWMGTTMAPWLAYKGWKYHSDNVVAKAQVDARVPVEGEVSK